MLNYHRATPRGLLRLGLVLGAATACAPADSGMDHAMSHLVAPQLSKASAGLGPQVSKGLASVRNATAKFHRVDVAIAAGYADPATITCVQSPAGAMGIHTARGASIDQTVVPDAPEVLLYLPRKDGGFKLVGVEYLVPVLVRNNATN